VGALAHCDTGTDMLALSAAMTVADHAKEKDLTALPVKPPWVVRHSKRRQGRGRPQRTSDYFACVVDARSAAPRVPRSIRAPWLYRQAWTDP
jgi:hypothetical protein